MCTTRQSRSGQGLAAAEAVHGKFCTLTCGECGKKWTIEFTADSPMRVWSTPNYVEAWDNAGGPRSPEIEEIAKGEKK